jgi:hypothetical protein
MSADLANYARDVDQRATYRDATFALVGSAVAAGAVAVLLYFLDNPKVEAAPVIAPEAPAPEPLPSPPAADTP